MKKLLIIFIALIYSFCVRAQNSDSIVIGARGGFNLATIGGKETDHKMKAGSHIGIFAEYVLIKPLHLEFEVLLSGQGHNPANDLDDKLKLTYLNIPLIVKFYPAGKFNVHAGPQFGFLLNAKAEYENLIIQVRDNFKSLDIGLALGAGYDFAVLGRDMNITARYIHGLTNISKDNVLPRYNRVLQISLGIAIFKVNG